MMNLKYASLTLNALLICVVIFLVRGQGDSEELIRSEERRIALEYQVVIAQGERDSLVLIGDSLRVVVNEKPKERILIKYNHDEEVNDIVSLNANESLSFLAGRLSQINLN